MTVKIMINGKIAGKLEFENWGRSDGDKFLYVVKAEQNIPGKNSFKFEHKKVLHIRDQGMMQLLANGLAALGWQPKPWSVPE